MRKLIIITLLILVFSAHHSVAELNEDQAKLKDMASKAQESSCENPLDYADLFMLSTSGNYTGAGSMEWLSEVNETVFFKCPSGFLLALSRVQEPERKMVLRYFGIVNPPWEIGAVLKTVVSIPELEPFIKTELAGFL